METEGTEPQLLLLIYTSRPQTIGDNGLPL